MPLKIGEEAPDFELDSHLGHKVRLSRFRGIKNVVVVFHPPPPPQSTSCFFFRRGFSTF